MCVVVRGGLVGDGGCFMLGLCFDFGLRLCEVNEGASEFVEIWWILLYCLHGQLSFGLVAAAVVCCLFFFFVGVLLVHICFFFFGA